MNVVKLDYNMEKFNEENVELILGKLSLNINNYFITMTRFSLLNDIV